MSPVRYMRAATWLLDSERRGLGYPPAFAGFVNISPNP